MTAAPEIVAENAAWERYRSYVLSKIHWSTPKHEGCFCGDEASHGLWREWRAARDIRDQSGAADLMRRRHKPT